MGRIRAWLRLNKIFFETVAALLLATMATIFSYAQLKVMQSQTLLAERQLQPMLNVHSYLVQNPETGMYDEERIVIGNDGAPASDLEVTAAVYLDVELPGATSESKPCSIMLTGYYTSQQGTGRTKGWNLREIWGYRNNARIAEVNRAGHDDKKAVVSFVTTRQYVRTTYSDSLGKRHEEYYQVGLHARHLDAVEGRAIFRAFSRQHRSTSTGTIRPMNPSS